MDRARMALGFVSPLFGAVCGATKGNDCKGFLAKNEVTSVDGRYPPSERNESGVWENDGDLLEAFIVEGLRRYGLVQDGASRGRRPVGQLILHLSIPTGCQGHVGYPDRKV